MDRSTIKLLFAVTMLLSVHAVSFAQPEAKIVGPREAPAGELVVLSSNGSTGDNLVWVKPDSIQTVQAGCTLLDQQIFFATTKVGKYEFMLIAADKEARISYTKHTVEIKGGSKPPVEPPPPIDPPSDPPTEGKWVKLQEASRTTSESLSDPTTRSKLKSALAATLLAIDSKCAAGQCPTLTEAKSQALKSIEGVLLTRIGPSAQVDWTQWRKSNQAELDRLGVVDLKDYVNALRAIASGL